ncbi:MAG TPA: type VI secretion system baseplate subunit TssF [Limnobacter sp.]|nr:type VI secretion system baseplate subunit TssF [Limnobacter sp.]
MDPRLLQYYIQELAHVRDSGAEFAQRFPKIAARLGMDATEVNDPYVERLLEGFAFLAARIQLRLNEEFPRFTAHLLNRLSPNFLAPVPCMGVVQFNPDFNDAALKKGVHLNAGAVLHSEPVGHGSDPRIQTRCRFSVGHAITLLPLEIKSVAHGPVQGKLPETLGQSRPRSALQIKIHDRSAQGFANLKMDQLDFHVSCSDEYAYTLFDRIVGQTLSIGIRAGQDNAWTNLPLHQLKMLGLDDSDALLPVTPSQFSGNRLLQEFFAFPQRFLFFRISGLSSFLQQVSHDTFELALFFGDIHPVLDQVVDSGFLALNCTPVVNLFEHSCDRVLLDPCSHEMHLQPSRIRPQDFEVHSILSVQAHGHNCKQEVLPLFSGSTSGAMPGEVCFSYHRAPTLLSERQNKEAGRTAYVGSEVYLSLTQPTGELAENHGFQQLQVTALCSNRDLPLFLPLGQGTTDLGAPGHLPLRSIRFLRGPGRPVKPVAIGQTCWQLVEHLAINYMGLTSPETGEDGSRSSLLNQLLSLHADPAQPVHQLIARAVHQVKSRPVAQRLMRGGRPVVARGVHVQMLLDEGALQGLGLAALGGVLARYLASHVSINSFVRVSVQGLKSGLALEFPASIGNRPLL